ncbi:MAG: aminopeptidase [Bacillota bacterium]
MFTLDDIRDGTISMFQTNMGLQPGESVLVVSDFPTESHWKSKTMAELEDMVQRCLLGKAVSLIGSQAFPQCSVDFLAFPATGRSGTEPPDYVAQAMAAANVVIAITSFSLTHTEARGNACKRGARIASMPRFMPEMFFRSGPMAVDYHKVAQDTKGIAQLLSEADTAEVTSPEGTKLIMSLKGRIGLADDGIYAAPGRAGNLPAGEAYIAPVEGVAEGQIVVLPGWYPRLEQTMVLRISAGRVVDVSGGGAVGEELAATFGLSQQSPTHTVIARRVVGELGVGTNPNAKRTDIVLEAEKIRGTVHVGIGDNSHMGGVNVADFHQDFVIPRATLVLDGQRVVMKDGKLLV